MKRIFLLLAVLVATGSAARASEGLCWFSPKNLSGNVVCTGTAPGEWLNFASIRALLDAGWRIVDLTADPRFTEDGVRLVVERRPAPVAYTRIWMIFPPP